MRAKYTTIICITHTHTHSHSAGRRGQTVAATMEALGRCLRAARWRARTTRNGAARQRHFTQTLASGSRVRELPANKLQAERPSSQHTKRVDLHTHTRSQTITHQH